MMTIIHRVEKLLAISFIAYFLRGVLFVYHSSLFIGTGAIESKKKGSLEVYALC
jgi:hypothetical protein